MKRNNYIATLILATLCINGVLAQTKIPRLVVTISVDQMRSDYMQAFASLYGDGGFNLLMNEGRVYERAVNNFYPVDRASATATLSSGVTPYYNGIVASSWLDRGTLRPVFCTDDKRVKATEGTEAASARRLLTSTVGDELKVFTQGRAKVYGIAPNKDSAILTAGHAADCALWIDDITGKWTTTPYYKNSKLNWVDAVSSLNEISRTIGSVKWTPKQTYMGNVSLFMGGGVQSPFSHTFSGDHAFVQYKRSGLVNEKVTDLALRCLEANALGNDEITDLLSLTYYAGLYKDGALSECSRELQDTYVRLDVELQRLISYIDRKLGRDNVMFVLTSTGYDEVTCDDYAKMGIPSGTVYINRTANLLNMYLAAMYGNGQYVDGVFHNHIYFNRQLLEQKRLSMSEILLRSREFLAMSDGVRDVHTSERILSPNNDELYKIRNAYNPSLSGDIIVEIAPGWKVVNEDTNESFTASASNSVFQVVFYGAGVQKEKVGTLITTDCIAPTICKSIRIRAPNGCKSLPLF